MAKKLFTERQGMGLPRVAEKLDANTSAGLLAIIKGRVEENLFGEAFPRKCHDGEPNIGCDTSALRDSLKAHRVIDPWDWTNEADKAVPSDAELFDLIEFLYEHAALPKSYHFHSFFEHDHFSYDQTAGRAKFAEDINRIFTRNGMAFELVEGEVTRVAPMVLREALAGILFKTGDEHLDRILETAREKFLHRALEVRKEGLEKIWDAFERLKTLESGKDKSAQIKAILDKSASEAVLREYLEVESRELTRIGNGLMIRHTETNKPPINESAQVDYLFHRAFAFVHLLLRSSGRAG